VAGRAAWAGAAIGLAGAAAGWADADDSASDAANVAIATRIPSGRVGIDITGKDGEAGLHYYSPWMDWPAGHGNASGHCALRLSLQKAGNRGQSVIPHCNIASVRSYSHQTGLTMRCRRQVFAVAILFLATPSVAEPSRQEPDIDMFALMTGKCSTLKIAGRDFACRSVAYFHSQQGRAHFRLRSTTPPTPVTSSRSRGQRRREQDNLYELSIDGCC